MSDVLISYYHGLFNGLFYGFVCGFFITGLLFLYGIFTVPPKED